jgi:NAD(P)-dependent dehydrogenase (short-subunit alcohol dehydrogenase family)
MDLKLKDKLALVSGSTSGIGKAIATSLLKEGAQVVITGRSSFSIDKVKDELSALGKAYFVIADVTKSESVNKLMEEVYSYGELDIIVNNVGFWEECEFENITDEEWLRMFDLNFFGAIRTLRYCFPRMLKRKEGRVINIASEVGFKPFYKMIHYDTAKTALISLSRGLAEQTRGTNVTVNSVLPGPTWTDGEAAYQAEAAKKAGEDLDVHIRKFFCENEPNSIVQRFLMPEEIAYIVTCYCSPLASATNGASIRADGGIVRFL